MSSLVLRPPRATDAAKIWRMAPQFGGADHDSCYGFLLLCTHFSDTGLVAEAGVEVVGFALGYRPPAYPRQLFVWQLGPRPSAEGPDLRVRLLDELMARPSCASAEFLCMTRSSKDTALRDVLETVARRRGARCTEAPSFSREFFAEPHPDEHLIRIGPWAQAA